MKKVFFLTIGLLCIFFYAQAQGNTLHNQHSDTFIHFDEMFEFYESLNASQKKESNHYYYGSTYDYVLKVKSLGIVRKIRTSKLSELKQIFKLYHNDINADKIFKYEVFVENKGYQFWIPIQEELVLSWKEENPKGKHILVNVTLFGTYDNGHTLDWIYTMNAFEPKVYKTLWEIAHKSYDEGRFENASNIIKELIIMSPNKAENYSFQGEVFYSLFELNAKPAYLQKAFSAVNKCGELGGELSDANFYVKALHSFHKEEYDQALQYTNKASERASVQDGQLIDNIKKLETKILSIEQ